MKFFTIVKLSYIEGRTKAHLKKLVGEKAVELEKENIPILMEAFLKPNSNKSMLYLVITSIVIIGYFMTVVKICVKRAIRFQDYK